MRAKVTAAAALAALLALTACSGGEDEPAKGAAIRIGAISSLTGSSSATFQDFPTGIRARLEAYEASQGACSTRGFEVVEADDASSADGALTAAQSLITTEQVFAVLGASSFFDGASSYLAKDGASTLVIGGGFDGAAEYASKKNNVFGVLPPSDLDATYDAPGDYLKTQGVTKMAFLSYGSETAAASLEQAKRSAAEAGITSAYYNDEVDFASPDTDDLAARIRGARADGVLLTLSPTTSLAVLDALREQRYLDDLDLVLLTSGYGPELLASQAARAAAQDATFTTAGLRPVELGGTAIETMLSAFAEHTEAKTTTPSFGAVLGYVEADLFVSTLEKAGCEATSSQLIETLRGEKSWDADGLLPTPRNFTKTSPSKVCSYYLTLRDDAFVPDPEGSPACGEKL